MSSPLYSVSEDEREEPKQPEISADHAECSISRRTFVKAAGVVSAGVATGMSRLAAAEKTRAVAAATSQRLSLTLRINGESHALTVDTRTTLLDALRESLGMTGSKKGCDHGQ